jgi:broad specificity phosphatase PhoE
MADLFYILRHGETDWNRDGRLQGQTDVPLNDVGRDQARSVASMLSCLDIADCYASDLVRAYETADIALSGHPRGIIPTAHEGLRERNFGSMNGYTHDEIERHKKENPDFYLILTEKDDYFQRTGNRMMFLFLVFMGRFLNCTQNIASLF